MARDNSPKIRQRAHLARKHNQRASYDRVLIVSEGSKTEPLQGAYVCPSFCLAALPQVSRKVAPEVAPEVTLEVVYLPSFGHLRLPQHLYTALQRFDAWIEPALLAEWARLIKGYALRANPHPRLVGAGV